MKIGISGGDLSDERLWYAKQLGADGITCSAALAPGYAQRGYPTAEDLIETVRRVQPYELELMSLRLPPQATHDVLYGQPGRDREIENLCQTVRAAGEAGIPTVFYNLTPWRSLDAAWKDTPGAPSATVEDVRVGSGPGRYYQVAGRGGAVLLRHTSARAVEDARRAPPESVAPYGQIQSSEMWERVTYLYERLIPVAERAGVNVGAHPDDPPESTYRGVQQILNCVDGLKKLTELVPSPRSGLLLCVGTLHEMGEDTMAAIESLLQRGKIFGVHFRNPTGTVPGGGYQEDFLDEGDLDMLDVMRLFHAYDYQGMLDPDHAVGISGDQGGRIGFAWELGYMKALKDVVEGGKADR